MKERLICTILCMMTMASVFGGSPGTEETRTPNVSELLDRYEATQKRLYSSCVMEFEAVTDAYRSFTYVLSEGRYQSKVKINLRTDGNRWYWIREMSGQCFPHPDRRTPETDPRVKRILNAGNLLYCAGQEPNWAINKSAAENSGRSNLTADEFTRSRKFITITQQPEKNSDYLHFTRRDNGRMQYSFPDMVGGGGHFHDPDLIHRLRHAQTISLLPKTENVNGSECYVVVAEYTRVVEDAGKQKINVASKIKVWFDRAHDYHLARYQEKSTDCNSDKNTWTPTQTIDNVLFQKINDIWVPMEWDFTFKNYSSPGKFRRSKSHVKRTQCLLAPDHEKLNSFVLDRKFLPDDVWGVRLNGFDGIDPMTMYIWDNGRVIDSQGNIIFETQK